MGLTPVISPIQATNKWWEFRHDKFIRGKPHLLSQIRRATHGAFGFLDLM